MAEENKLFSVFGEYRYGNGFFVDALSKHVEGCEYTEIHEMMHAILTRTTSYGALTLAFSRVNNIAKEKEWIYKELQAHMKRMQEAVATFCQYIAIAQITNKNLRNLIENLKETNKEYYGYIRPLVFLINIIEDDELLVALEIIRRISEYSLNIDISIFLLKTTYSCKKELHRVFIDNERYIYVTPNSRFKYCLSRLRDELKVKNIKDIKVSEIINENEYCLSDGIAKDILGLPLLIYEDSKQYEEIRRVVEQFSYTKEPISLLQSSPTLLNFLLEKQIQFGGVHLYKDFIAQFKDSVIIACFEGKFLLEHDDGKRYFTELFYNLSNNTCNFVLLNAYDWKGVIDSKEIMTIVEGRHGYRQCICGRKKEDELPKTFVYLDGSFENNLEFIKTEIGAVYYSFVEYDNFLVCLIKSKEAYFIQLISKQLLYVFGKIIKEKSIRMEFIEYRKMGFGESVNVIDIAINGIMMLINSSNLLMKELGRQNIDVEKVLKEIMRL